ncbi:hypothetical protein VPIG_00120 [Vibrio phage PWH3a-P1]|uniref:hypothetical protein n=1 Tax=Vibrio phage PWH3a-P1 TaxID=754058 RepID=UPI0002C04DDA|nr:hypothetical protein VPIG_00120 [Vibrio phage PWH3a-P1]AGH31977.1 hypothetical protein VPIG_00120 [Vibrio phage PWH3a-P1]
MKFENQGFSHSTNFVEEENTKPKRFKMCYVDSDTFVVRCAKLMQEDYIEVLHKPSGRKKEFKNKTEFGVRGEKVIEGKWLDQQNKLRESKNLEPFPLEDFEILNKAKLNPEFSTFEEALSQAEMVFASNIKGVKENMESEDYTLCMSSGNGNYRDYESKTIGYKSGRGEKPIYFQEFKDSVAKTYKNKIWWTDNEESEDHIQYIAKQQEALYGEDQSKWDACAAFVDKDVLQVYIPRKNFDKYEDGWLSHDKMYCEKTLVAQTIAGDMSTDTIEGLPTLTESTTKYFGLRKANGVSKATAEKLLDGSKTIQEMWERAIFCYQQYYGFDKRYQFKDVHGKDQDWGWLDYMQQCYVLVKMRNYFGEIPCLRKYLSSIGVDYTKEIKYGETEVDTESLVENLEVCKTTLDNLKGLTKSYKSLAKPKLVERMDEVTKVVGELDGNLSMLEK